MNARLRIPKRLVYLDGVPVVAINAATLNLAQELMRHVDDMGPELAGGVGATRNEWRTPPLWGIGLTGTVSGHTQLLHDGRARDFSEAILWHGGEARASRDGFASLGADDRAALVAFLESL
jgi:CxxC motif-containing protein (DUF1111 family)